MTVSTIASIAAGLSRTTDSNPTARASELFKSLIDAGSAKVADQASPLTTALTLQNQVAQLRLASQNLAQATTLLSTADAGVADIEKDLGQLETLAKKVLATADDGERAALKSQFDSVLRRIDERANSTKFNNESLLNGSSSQLKLASANASIKDLAIGSVTTQALFSGGLPQIMTTTSAKVALDQIKDAKAYASKQRDSIRALEKGLDIASSSLQTAIQNNEAASSILDEGDLVSLLLGGGSSNSQLAQTGNLPSSVLNLLRE